MSDAPLQFYFPDEHGTDDRLRVQCIKHDRKKSYWFLSVQARLTQGHRWYAVNYKQEMFTDLIEVMARAAALIEVEKRVNEKVKRLLNE